MSTIKNGKPHKLSEQIRHSAKTSPVLFATYVILRLLVLIVMVLQLINRDIFNAMLCLLTLFLFSIPTFVERRIKVDIPNTLEVIILLFIFAAEILGEINEYYVNIHYWDTMLHTANGFLAATIGMALIDVLNKNGKLSISMSPVFVALVAFCFSMTVGVVWEFFEFGGDLLMKTDMQKDTFISEISTVSLHPEGKNIPVHLTDIEKTVIYHNVDGVITETEIEGYLDIGIIDTMRDLIVNFIGASVFACIGGIYIKHRGEGRNGRFVRRFLPTLMDDGSTSEDDG